MKIDFPRSHRNAEEIMKDGELSAPLGDCNTTMTYDESRLFAAADGDDAVVESLMGRSSCA